MENEKKVEENKTPEQKNDKNDKKAKPAKQKKEKRVIPDFDKIDITTATDDDIIQSGLKKNVHSDMVCYGIMAIIFALMVLPPALRFIVPKPITEEERLIAYVDINCRRAIQRDGYILGVDLQSHYRDSVVQNSVLKYTVRKLDEDAPDDYVFSEVNEMSNVNFKGVKKEVEGNVTTYTIDYLEEFDAMFQNEVLKNYMSVVTVELKYMSDNGFYCTQENKDVLERVYIDTGLKVED